MRFSKKLLKILVLVTILAMSCMLISSGAHNINQEEEELAALSDVPVDWDALQQDTSRWWFDCYVIPEGMLQNMSTKALVQSLCDYPLLIELVSLSNSFSVNYIAPFAEMNEVVQELKSREDRKECIDSVRTTVCEQQPAVAHILVQILDYAYK